MKISSPKSGGLPAWGVGERLKRKRTR